MYISFKLIASETAFVILKKRNKMPRNQNYLSWHRRLAVCVIRRSLEQYQDFLEKAEYVKRHKQ